jgi:hypothetical protein
MQGSEGTKPISHRERKLDVRLAEEEFAAKAHG